MGVSMAVEQQPGQPEGICPGRGVTVALASYDVMVWPMGIAPTVDQELVVKYKGRSQHYDC